jgi:hypothetical protein
VTKFPSGFGAEIAEAFLTHRVERVSQRIRGRDDRALPFVIFAPFVVKFLIFFGFLCG